MLAFAGVTTTRLTVEALVTVTLVAAKIVPALTITDVFPAPAAVIV